jgi:hypothetical protein
MEMPEEEGLKEMAEREVRGGALGTLKAPVYQPCE